MCFWMRCQERLRSFLHRGTHTWRQNLFRLVLHSALLFDMISFHNLWKLQSFNQIVFLYWVYLWFSKENNILHKGFRDVVFQLFQKKYTFEQKNFIVAVLLYSSLRESNERDNTNKFVLFFQRVYGRRDSRKEKNNNLKYLVNLGCVPAYLHTEAEHEFLIICVLLLRFCKIQIRFMLNSSILKL